MVKKVTQMSEVPERAVILAAGFGTRMGRKPKGLVRVAGKEILWRTITMLSRLGVSEFIVVTNPKYAQAYSDFLDRVKLNADVRIVINKEPERGNGYSLHVARGFTRGRFILTMSDHVYSEEFLRAAVMGSGLIADRTPRFADVGEATKVKVSNGRVVKVGKELEEWDAVDTGFFIVDDRIFDVTSRMVKEAEVLRLSDVVEAAGLKVTFVDGLPWMDVDTPEDAVKARRMLVKTAVKGTGDGFISRHLNRKISTRISYLLVEHVGPYPVTVVTFLVGILSGLLNLLSPPIAAVIYQIDSILDGVDGELARARLESTKFGGYLDSILDRYVDGVFLAVLAYKTLSEPSWYLIALMALLGSVMVSYSTERFRGEYCSNPYSIIKGLRYVPGKRDERIFLSFVMIPLGLIKPFFVVIAALTNFRVLLTVLFAGRKSFMTENYLTSMKYSKKGKEV